MGKYIKISIMPFIRLSLSLIIFGIFTTQAFSSSFLHDGVSIVQGKIVSKDMSKNEVTIIDNGSKQEKTFIVRADKCAVVQEGDEVIITFETGTIQSKWIKFVRSEK